MSADSRISGGRRHTRGVAGDELRRHNLGTVLERLHLSGPESRSDLVAATGLNRSTIGDLVGQLTELGMVEETADPAASGPGRPSPLVQTRPQGATVLAVELAVDSVAVATVGLGGHIYNRLRVERPRGHRSPDETVLDVSRLAEPLLDALPARKTLAGIGVAVVGITRRSDGFVHLAPNLGWRDIPLGELFARELALGVPVMVANEADLGAWGEYRRGHRPVGHLVYVSGEVGIGVGAIIDGKPLLGAAGYAGEAGHMLINPAGVECRCGATGCWETEAGEAALVRRMSHSDGTTGAAVVDALAQRAATGHAPSRRALSQVGRWLGLGIGNLINIFNPELVVLGGLYERIFSFVEPAVVEAAERTALAAPREMATIAASELGADAPLLGAAELVLAGVIADPARAGM
jgi:predicted NBD/HSP70 family sugar kinase